MRRKNRKIKHIHLRPIGGVSGDMFLAALLDLGANRDSIEKTFESLEIPNLFLETTRVCVKNFEGMYVRSIAPQQGQHHTSLSEIENRIAQAASTPKAKRVAMKIFEVLAVAEARVHGGGSDSVHLHEVGAMDSLMDVLGGAVAYTELGSPRITYEPIPIGHGTVNTSHGWLEIPVPAVKEICDEYSLDLSSVEVEGETLTPTGAALIAALNAESCTLPTNNFLRHGVGAGTARFPERANVLEVFGYGDA